MKTKKEMLNELNNNFRRKEEVHKNHATMIEMGYTNSYLGFISEVIVDIRDQLAKANELKKEELEIAKTVANLDHPVN